MKSIARLAVVLAITGTGGMAVVAPATAAPAYDPQVLVQKAFEGTITASEKAALVKSYPDVAAVVPDLSAGVSHVRAATVIKESGGVTPAAVTACMTYTGWNTLKSLLGFTIYRFQHSATACSNGSVITSHSSPKYEISQADATVADWSVVDKYVTNVGTTQSKSRIQVRVTQCVLKYGCYAYTYPTGTIVANRNNTASITTTI